MPKSANHYTLARQWEILKKIPSHSPGITASELTSWLKDSGFAVSKRSVERDLNELASLFGIRSNTESVPFGWYWLPNARPNFDTVDLAEALSLLLAEGVLATILPVRMRAVLASKFELARKKLAALETLPFSKWTNKVRYIPDGLTFVPPSIGESILETIQNALVEEKQITVLYDPIAKKRQSLILHPLSLVQRGVRTYLVAIVDGFVGERLFALQRFRKIEMLDKKISVPKKFSIDKYIADGNMEFGECKEIVFKARLSEDAACYLAEAPLSKDQRISYKNGAYHIAATLKETWQLKFWILSQGAGVEVTAPKSLINNIAKEVAEMHKFYSAK